MICYMYVDTSKRVTNIPNDIFFKKINNLYDLIIKLNIEIHTKHILYFYIF